MADQRSRGFGTTAARCIAVAHTTMLIPTICAAQQRSTPARPSTKPPETCAARSGHRVARCGCWARETAPTSRRSLSKPEPRAHQNLQNADRLRNRSSPDSPLWPFFIPLPSTGSRSAEGVNGPKREQAWPCPLSGACVWQRLTPEHAGNDGPRSAVFAARGSIRSLDIVSTSTVLPFQEATGDVPSLSGLRIAGDPMRSAKCSERELRR